MSDKKFNLKTYQKINGDEHIDMRLEESREEAPNVINEKQLESYRATEPNVVIEKLLEDKRTGAETEITEKCLDTHKSKFANKYRNPEAHEGDMNKLEEQRLNGDPMEKEKYAPASEAPKQFRWWEDKKSPDGLKVAKEDTKKTVTAQEDVPPRVMEEPPQDFDVIEEKATPQEMYIKKEKFLPNIQKPYLSGIYIVLSFDPDAFSGNESEIKTKAMDKVVGHIPALSGLISMDDFYDIQEGIDEGTVKMRVIGEQFAPIVDGKSPEKVEKKDEIIPSEEGPIEEISYKEEDIEGTPTIFGRVAVNIPITEVNRDNILNDVVDFINNKHVGIKLGIDSLDLTNIDKGEIGYMIGAPNEMIREPSREPSLSESDFDIIVESASSKKNSTSTK